MEFIDGVILIEEIWRFPMMFLITVFVIAALGLMATIHCAQRCFEAEKGSGRYVILGLIIVTVMGANTYELYKDPFNLKKPTGEYKVIVTAEADMTEFQDTYEIVDYKNGVYTIKAKSNEN